MATVQDGRDQPQRHLQAPKTPAGTFLHRAEPLVALDSLEAGRDGRRRAAGDEEEDGTREPQRREDGREGQCQARRVSAREHVQMQGRDRVEEGETRQDEGLYDLGTMGGVVSAAKGTDYLRYGQGNIHGHVRP